MAANRASQAGLQQIDAARQKRNWGKQEQAWCDLALTSKATLKRFWRGQVIQQEAFVGICQAAGIENWETISALPEEQENIFGDLETFLQNRQWEEADGETARLMILLSGDKSETQFKTDATNNFPCSELLKLDSLWGKYSQGKFGFTIQKTIWSRSRRDFKIFSNKVGWHISNTWLKGSDLKYDLSAPPGHLPSLHWVHIQGWAIGNENVGHNLHKLLEKISNCLSSSPQEENTLPKPHIYSSITMSSSSPQPASLPLTAFVSYSHRDEDFKDELVVHLANLKRQSKIRAWQDREIEAGAEWNEEIRQQLETAQVILLLISPRFMASDYCYDLEMQRAVQRHDEGTARVIPIIIKPCDWQGSPFSRLQVLPKDARPITKWDDRDDAFLNVVQGIRKAIESLQAAQSRK